MIDEGKKRFGDLSGLRLYEPCIVEMPEERSDEAFSRTPNEFGVNFFLTALAFLFHPVYNADS
jgi:hypothetical protein